MNQILIQPSPWNDDEASWLVSGEGKPAIEHGTLDDAIAAASGHVVIILAPSERVVLTHTNLQIRSAAKLRKAVPYALEEQLAEDVEELHFAIGPQTASGYPVAVMEHELIAHWLQRFKQHHINPRAIIPDVLALPWQEGDWFVATDQQRALMRSGQFSGFACDRENLETLLAASLAGTEHQPENLHLWACGDSTPLQWEQETPKLLRHRCDGEMLHLLAEGIDLRNSINLLQGEYSVQTSLITSLKPWRWAAGLAALLFLIAYAHLFIEKQQLKTQQLALQQQAEQIYRQTFPQARKVINPRLQMEQQLKKLRGGDANDSRGDFLPLLATSGKVLTEAKNVQLESIRYRNGRLDMKIRTDSLSALDALKNNMIKAGLQAELKDADAAGNKATGNLRVTQP